MFGILLKKQLFEVFRSWFYNHKTGKVRSKKGTVGMMLLFLLLIVGLLGGGFTAMAIGISKPLCLAGAGYLYFIIFGLISVTVGLFGSVFNTYSELYLAKDNDLLFSLPIPVSVIAASRLFCTYLMGLLYSSVAFVPAVVVWQIVSGFTLLSLIGNLTMLLEISLLVWGLSCLIGFVIAKVSLKLKNRSFVGVLAALAFMGLYYFVYFKAQVMIRDLVQNVSVYGEKIQGSAYLLYAWGKNGLGSLPELLICLAVSMTLALLTWLILSRTFFKLATTSRLEKQKSTDLKKTRERSVSAALLKKEFARFIGSANYMLNCGLGVIFILAAGVVLLIKGDAILSIFSENLGTYAAVLPVGLVAIVCMLASMNDSAAPSISLEGKNLWIIQSLPIESWEVLKAKIKLQLILTEVPMLFLNVGVMTLLAMSLPEKLACTAMLMTFPILSALFNMLIGLKMPIFNWNNEIVPIKQSGGVAIALFGSWGYALLMILGYIGLMVLNDGFSAAVYLTIVAVITAIGIAYLYHRLKTKGVEILRNL